MTEIEKIFEQLKVASDEELCELELDLFSLVYDRKEKNDVVRVFLALSNWVGFSLRDGVWTFYEYTDVNTIEKTMEFLNKSNEDELKRMFELGNHDYHNEAYAENYDYPEEWLTESEIIDDWIFKNEKKIYRKIKEILLENEAVFLE